MFNVDNSAIMSGWSFILSAVSFVVTVGGFLVTIYQVRRARGATEAVNERVKFIRQQVDLFDISLDYVRCTKSLEQVIAYLRMSRNDLAITPLWEAQLTLSRIEAIEETKGPDQRSAYFLDQIQRLEESTDKGVDFDAIELLARARQQINTLQTRISTRQKDLYNA